MSNLAIQALITAFADGKAIAGESSTRAAISEVTADKPNRHREHHDHQHAHIPPATTNDPERGPGSWASTTRRCATGPAAPGA